MAGHSYSYFNLWNHCSDKHLNRHYGIKRCMPSHDQVLKEPECDGRKLSVRQEYPHASSCSTCILHDKMLVGAICW